MQRDPLACDAENRVTSITGSGVNATYVYDGDGKRVKATVGGVTTVYIGNYYERDNGTTVRKYYYAGAVRVAMRTGVNTFYLLNDHLTSTAITTNSSGVRQTELRYFAYGGTRYDAGSQMTLYRYTGQRVETGTGLYDYGARWYDPQIGRFLAADSIVPNPGDSQALNRYMYVLGNPLKYSDPSGHAACGADDRACWEEEWYWKNRWYNAHGYFDNGNGWSAQGLPVYSDIGILLDTLAEVGVPTIRDILPGGAYGMGQILYGGIMLSIYRPPTVRVFTGQDTIRPIVGLWFGASISGGSQIVDDWFGDLCPSGTCTRPGTWGNVDIRISTQIPNVWEFVTGFAIGLGQSPESLPPGPDTTRAEMRGDLRATVLYGFNAAGQEGRLNMFVLQQDAQDHLRLIILTRQFSDNRANYVTANGLYPVGVMPVCVQGW